MRSRFRDHRHDTLKMLHHLFIREAQYTISLRSEPLIALTVVTKALGEIVRLAIDLNDKFTGMSNEVGNVVAHRTLSATAELREPMSLEVTP